MKIWLPIIPSLLQHRLQPMRLALLGQQVIVRVEKPGKHRSFFGSISSRRQRAATPLQKFMAVIQWLILAASLGVAVIWFGPDLKYRLQTTSINQAKPWLEQSINQLNGLVGLPTSTPTPAIDSNINLAQTPVAGQSGQNGLVGNFNEPPVNQATRAADPNNRHLTPVNENLPVGDWFSIAKIGVRSQLQATTSYEEALKTGLWQAPEFGKPGSLEMPMIVAGHRYGWKWWWKDDYWKYNSFYLLPQVEVGDRIEIISEQRKWIYEVYAAEEGTEITDYQADLIVYTCKYLQSPLRYFRYAKLISDI